MGLTFNIVSLFTGLGDFFGFFRDFFAALPLPVQALMYFAFGGFMLLMLLKMLFTRG